MILFTWSVLSLGVVADGATGQERTEATEAIEPTAAATQPGEEGAQAGDEAEVLELEATMTAFDESVVLGEPVRLVVVVRNPHEVPVWLPEIKLAEETSAEFTKEGEEVMQTSEKSVADAPVPTARLVVVVDPTSIAIICRAARAPVSEAAVMIAPLGPGEVRMYLITLTTGWLHEAEADVLQQKLQAAEPGGIAVERAEITPGEGGPFGAGEHHLYLKFDSRGLPDPDMDYTEVSKLTVIDSSPPSPQARFATNRITVTLTEPEPED